MQIVAEARRVAVSRGDEEFDAFPEWDNHLWGKEETTKQPSLNNFPMQRLQRPSSPKRLSSMQAVFFLLEAGYWQIIRPKSLCTTALDRDT
jgi:hypothetical protein